MSKSWLRSIFLTTANRAHFGWGQKNSPLEGGLRIGGELAMADSWYFVNVRGNIRKNRQGRLRGRALG